MPAIERRRPSRGPLSATPPVHRPDRHVSSWSTGLRTRRLLPRTSRTNRRTIQRRARLPLCRAHAQRVVRRPRLGTRCPATPPPRAHSETDTSPGLAQEGSQVDVAHALDDCRTLAPAARATCPGCPKSGVHFGSQVSDRACYRSPKKAVAATGSWATTGRFVDSGWALLRCGRGASRRVGARVFRSAGTPDARTFTGIIPTMGSADHAFGVMMWPHGSRTLARTEGSDAMVPLDDRRALLVGDVPSSCTAEETGRPVMRFRRRC
jgi:hypothetical protein